MSDASLGWDDRKPQSHLSSSGLFQDFQDHNVSGPVQELFFFRIQFRSDLRCVRRFSPSGLRRDGTTTDADAAFRTAPVLLCHNTAASMLGKLCGIFLRIYWHHRGENSVGG